MLSLLSCSKGILQLCIILAANNAYISHLSFLNQTLDYRLPNQNLLPSSAQSSSAEMVFIIKFPTTHPVKVSKFTATQIYCKANLLQGKFTATQIYCTIELD